MCPSLGGQSYFVPVIGGRWEVGGGRYAVQLVEVWASWPGFLLEVTTNQL